MSAVRCRCSAGRLPGVAVAAGYSDARDTQTGRGGQVRRGERGHREPGAQRQARHLGRDPGRRADRAGRARLRAAHQAARRTGPAGRSGPAGAAQPDLPGVRRGGRRRAGQARPHPGAVHPYGRRRLRGRLRRHAAGPARLRRDLRRRQLRAGRRRPRALPPAARARPAGRAGQRGDRRPRLPDRLGRRRASRSSRRTGTCARSVTSGSAWCSARATTCRPRASWPRSTTASSTARPRARRGAGRADDVLDGGRPGRRRPADQARRDRPHLRLRRAGPRRDPRRAPARA